MLYVVHKTVLVKQSGMLISEARPGASGSVVRGATSINVVDPVEVDVAEGIEANVLATASAEGI